MGDRHIRFSHHCGISIAFRVRNQRAVASLRRGGPSRGSVGLLSDMSESSEFSAGDRVRVLEGSQWAEGAVGTVAPPPDSVDAHGAWDGGRCARIQGGRVIYGHWVEFDTPQFNADGTGPHLGGAVDAECLVAHAD